MRSRTAGGSTVTARPPSRRETHRPRRRGDRRRPSGDAAGVTATSYIPFLLNTVSSGEYALNSGVAAAADAVTALSSGNAALELLETNPFISESELLGLIIALS